MKSMSKRARAGFWRAGLAFAALFLTAPALAQVSPYTNFTGRLVDGGGTPLASPVSFDLLIYDTDTGGTALYAEQHTGVVLDSDGSFSVLMGTGTTVPPTPASTAYDSALFASGPRWVEVVLQAPSQESLTPRVPLSSAPWALVAQDLVPDPNGPFRDCGDYRNRLPRRYHAGETNDIRYFLEKLVTEGQCGPICAAGYSLGGSVLLKYLGENGATTPLQAAAAVSVPLDLGISADALNKGFSKVYQRHLLKRMKESVSRKFDQYTAAFDWHESMAAKTFAEFDDLVTAPLHGFDGKDDYYGSCSSAAFLQHIERPTLIVNSTDDPFMTPEVIPDASLISDCVTLELSSAGGHVGFVEGGTPWRPRYYLPGRIIGFLNQCINDSERSQPAMPGL